MFTRNVYINCGLLCLVYYCALGERQFGDESRAVLGMFHQDRQSYSAYIYVCWEILLSRGDFRSEVRRFAHRSCLALFSVEGPWTDTGVYGTWDESQMVINIIIINRQS